MTEARRDRVIAGYLMVAAVTFAAVIVLIST
jgi:hypothetical protein